MKRKTWLFVLFGMIVSCCRIHAQHTFSGTVTDEKNAVLSGAQIVLSLGDSIYAASLSDEKGKFSIPGIPNGTYGLSISFLGYTILEEQRNINNSRHYTFSLVQEMNIELQNVEITANSGDIVKRTATGQIFYLSEKAKSSGNPYLALREVPRLISNDATQSVKMDDGSTPLILIDGIAVNSGIAPIDPEDIESVEIVDVVNARYLRTGAKHILNIKLKKKRRLYRFFEAMNRFDFPARKETSAVYFEVGNGKYSLYGRGAFDKIWHNDRDIELWQHGDAYDKISRSSSYAYSHNYIGELLFKWMATPKNYFAFHLYGNNNSKNSRAKGGGYWETVDRDSFTFRSAGTDDSDILTASFYHKHSFDVKKTLETTFAFNRNINKTDGERLEHYSYWLYKNTYKYDNARNSSTLNIDYTWNIGSGKNLNVGSETRFLKDRIDRISDSSPRFDHSEWSEYIYASYTGKIKKLNYMLSAGYEGIWLKAGDESASRVRPRLSAGGTYSFNANNSLRADFKWTNKAPDVNQLNPYNISTDSLVVMVGNPSLTPMQNHSFGLSYSFNYQSLYISPSFSGNIHTDDIERYGYIKDDIYINTYRNSGRYSDIELGCYVSCRLGSWGNIYAGAYHGVDYYKGQNAKKSFNCGGGFSASCKKFSIYGDVTYRNYSYTSVSRTKYHAPDYSSVQVNYTIFPGFYVAVALQYMNAPFHTDVLTESYGYRSLSSMKHKDQSFVPWLLLRYTFRKNAKSKIKLEQVLKSREQGIELQR